MSDKPNTETTAEACSLHPDCSAARVESETQIIICLNCKGRGGWDMPEDSIVCECCDGNGRIRITVPQNAPGERPGQEARELKP